MGGGTHIPKGTGVDNSDTESMLTEGKEENGSNGDGCGDESMESTDEAIFNIEEKARDNKEEEDEEEYEENNDDCDNESSDSEEENNDETASGDTLPEIYANNKRVVLLLGKVTSVQFARGVCTVFLVLIERWKLWLV